MYHNVALDELGRNWMAVSRYQLHGHINEKSKVA